MTGAVVMAIIRQPRLGVEHRHAARAVHRPKILGVLTRFGLGAVWANRFVRHPVTIPLSPRLSIAQEASA